MITRYNYTKKIKFHRLFYYLQSLFKLCIWIKPYTLLYFYFQLISGKISSVSLKSYNLVFKLKSLLDLLTLKEVVLDEEYESLGVKIEKRDKIIVDIGAGFGDFSILTAKKYPKTKIYAFEPDPVYFRLLTENIDINKIRNIFPSDKAIYDLKTLFAAIGSKTIDFMKMDCEGCEFSIFDPKRKVFFSRVGKIVMEYHESYNRKYSQIINILLKAGFNAKTKSQKDVLGIGYIAAKRQK